MTIQERVDEEKRIRAVYNASVETFMRKIKVGARFRPGSIVKGMYGDLLAIVQVQEAKVQSVYIKETKTHTYDVCYTAMVLRMEKPNGEFSRPVRTIEFWDYQTGWVDRNDEIPARAQLDLFATK